MANNRPPALEFPDSLEWVNSEAKFSMREQRGRVTLLHFFTYSNVHCLQALGELRKLENAYDNGLTLFGVHCPKFAYERDPAHVLKAINRLHIRHPVINDPKFTLWNAYGVKAWPTVVVVDYSGRIYAQHTGAGHYEEIDGQVDQLLLKALLDDKRADGPLPKSFIREPQSKFKFPGGIAAHGKRLYISDTGHNNILETTYDGNITRQFGAGQPGLWDGVGSEAGFCEPRGLAVGGNNDLMVADTGNHAVRRVNLLTGETETLMGKGQDGRDNPGELPPRATRLSFPWGVAASRDKVYVAMAGRHQIWSYDLARRKVALIAGSGKPGLHDGKGIQARFAKPTGVTMDDKYLYVSDADSSALRRIRIIDHKVETLVGAGLFKYGNQDGEGDEARMQHPGAAFYYEQGSLLWLCDSFNDTLRTWDRYKKELATPPLDYPWAEPGGVFCEGNNMWVANTNAHEVVHVRLSDGTITPLDIK